MIPKPYKQLLLTLFIGMAVLHWLSIDVSADSKNNPPANTAIGGNILRVGVSTNAPPLIFKQDGKVVGLEADLAKALAADMGRSVKFVEVKWDDQIQALLDKKTDIIMSGMSITRLRQVRIAFSNPYFRSGQIALVHIKDLDRFKMGYPAFAKSRAIGTVKNTTGDIYVREKFSATKVIDFSTSKKGVEALISGKIEVFIHDAPIILQLASENEDKNLKPVFSVFLTEEYLAWGIRRQDAAIMSAANRILDTIKKDGRLMQMVKRWIPLAK